MQDVYDSWRRAVERAFAETGKSRSWLAAQCGVADSTIKRVLEGDIIPSDGLKWRLAGALGKRVDELFWYPNVVPAKTWLTADEQAVSA